MIIVQMLHEYWVVGSLGRLGCMGFFREIAARKGNLVY